MHALLSITLGMLGSYVALTDMEVLHHAVTCNHTVRIPYAGLSMSRLFCWCL
jgi:hypothetical protein